MISQSARPCPGCQLGFATRKELARHRRRSHPPIRTGQTNQSTTLREPAKSRITRLRRQLRKLIPEALPAGPRQSPRRFPAGTGVAARTHSAPSPAGQTQVRHLEKTGGWTRRERLRILWYRLRLTVQEMNYSARRLVELQTRLP